MHKTHLIELIFNNSLSFIVLDTNVLQMVTNKNKKAP